METYYTIYKITKKINGKIYIGCHKTNDLEDGYMGSGKYLKRSINKHGLEHFEKEIIKVFDTPEEMFQMKAVLVNEKFVKSIETYNLKEGGSGGFDHITKSSYHGSEAHIINSKKAGVASGVANSTNEVLKAKRALIGSRNIKLAKVKSQKLHPKGNGTFRGKTHTDETKRKMSLTQRLRNSTGERNSQYGTMWITNGVINKKIKKGGPTPDGFRNGRVM